MSRLLAWFRFHGWRNAYWREDWYMTLCSHGSIYTETGTSSSTVWWSICADCGKPL